MSLFSGSRLPSWLAGMLFYGLALLILLRPFGLTWHDWQRSGQIMLGVAAALYLLCTRAPLPFDRQSRSILALVAVGGLLSSALARQPLWGVTEVALMATCVTILWATASLRQSAGSALDRILLTGTALICGIKLLQFLIMYGLVLARGDIALDLDRLMDGFSNQRFYGQFITLTLPLLALPLLSPGRRSGLAIRFFMLLAGWWMLAIASGTRGTWLAMAVTMPILALTGNAGRRWASWQLLGAMAGFGLFWLLFNAAPGWIGLEVGNHPAHRMNTSLSLRDSLWLQAWQMIKAYPLLGAGPMHFAEIFNGNAVHPHNALLQWLAEWGIPSALVLTWALWRAARSTWQVLRTTPTAPGPHAWLYLCLAGSVLAALTQSMVDGVIVMPYSQLWLSLLAGWLLALHPKSATPAAASPGMKASWLGASMAATVLLLAIMIRDLPNLAAQQNAYLAVHDIQLMPRFWCQGLIAPASEGSSEGVQAKP